MASRGLSAEFADIITIGEDLTEAQGNIDKLDRLFKAAVKAEVERRLTNNDIPKNGQGSEGQITKEAAKKMNLAQLTELMEKNPELYQKLFN